MNTLRFILLGLLIFGSLIAQENHGIILSLSSRDNAHPEIVTIRLVNNSGHDVYYLNWWMPSHGKLEGNPFEFTDFRKQEVPYIGIWAYYGEPKRKDYVPLKRGEVVEERIDVTKNYQVRRGAKYSLKINRMFEYYDSADAAESAWCPLKSNELELKLEMSLWEKFCRLFSSDHEPTTAH